MRSVTYEEMTPENQGAGVTKEGERRAVDVLGSQRAVSSGRREAEGGRCVVGFHSLSILEIGLALNAADMVLAEPDAPRVRRRAG